MRKFLFCLALTLGGAANADQLADANAALAAKSYPQALQMFTTLAAAGNGEAQLRLGEMYWYGEGVALDRAKGDALFAQAAAKGVQGAREATALSGQRQARQADIAHWSGAYDGADLKAGQCTAPSLPPVSRTNEEIAAANAAVAAWRDCYTGYVNKVADAMPPGKRIPADVIELMSEHEVQQAKSHLAAVYTAILADAKARADAFLAVRDGWERATLAHVGQQNKVVKDRQKQLVTDLENRQRTRSFERDSTFVTHGRR